MTPVSLYFIVVDTHSVDPAVVGVLQEIHPPRHRNDGLWSWSHMSMEAADATAAVIRGLQVPATACAGGIADGLPYLGGAGSTPLGAGLELVSKQGRSTVRRRNTGCSGSSTE